MANATVGELSAALKNVLAVVQRNQEQYPHSKMIAEDLGNAIQTLSTKNADEWISETTFRPLDK